MNPRNLNRIGEAFSHAVARIYVSSTYLDLQECSKQVNIVIRKMGHEDDAMEYYVAEDRRATDRCLLT